MGDPRSLKDLADVDDTLSRFHWFRGRILFERERWAEARLEYLQAVKYARQPQLRSFVDEMYEGPTLLDLDQILMEFHEDLQDIVLDRIRAQGFPERHPEQKEFGLGPYFKERAKREIFQPDETWPKYPNSVATTRMKEAWHEIYVVEEDNAAKLGIFYRPRALCALRQGELVLKGGSLIEYTGVADSPHYSRVSEHPLSERFEWLGERKGIDARLVLQEVKLAWQNHCDENKNLWWFGNR